MKNKTNVTLRLENRILTIRGQKVIIDADLAELYGVETRRLNEQVRRNQNRFPADFIFELTSDEFADLKSQFATSSWGGRRKLPLAFTEHGAILDPALATTPFPTFPIDATFLAIAGEDGDAVAAGGHAGDLQCLKYWRLPTWTIRALNHSFAAYHLG